MKAVDFLTGPKGISSLMASGSRDGQLKLWSIGKDNQAEFIASHQEHSNFVNAVSFIERSEDHPSGIKTLQWPRGFNTFGL